MRRSEKTTTYGQRGGDGPNTGKSAVTWTFTRPDGEIAVSRQFRDNPEGNNAFILCHPPHNGHGWMYSRAEATREDFDQRLAEIARDNAKYDRDRAMPTDVACTRKG